MVEDEPQIFILPDSADVSGTEIKQELHMEIADDEVVNKETEDQLQPSGSSNSTHREVGESLLWVNLWLAFHHFSKQIF